MNREFPKTYTPETAENKWYEIWQKNKIYSASNKSPKPAYSILMPPPNVTGILHFGHVLNHTLQDLFIRRKRMQGFEVCWFPGTDHAGIATQTRVEKELKEQNLTRYDLGREKFLEKVWQWKGKYGNIIISQLKKLGISCDWDRTIFTLDETASKAVKEVFIRLFDDGLIYKGKRIINWSPLAQTALSDEEVEFKEINEHLYTLRYYFVEEPDKYLQVATVRPETIFGDIAVAVNPNDERYKNYIGKKVIVPLVDRQVEIIADEYADPDFGTGCVKITPAHDPNDFEVGQRHNLEMINTINPDGTLNELTGEFNGLDRFIARKKILKKLEELELIEKIEDYTHNVGFSQRGGEPIEPYLSDQWFVAMKPLAEQALKVVLDGEIKFYPNHWLKTYEHWMSNIRDWCISRQLWWGHRIPVYYTPDGKFTAARNEEEAREKLAIGNDVQLQQDEDVLDTWFSSWIWPLTTMRWLADDDKPASDDMKKFMPTDLLVTAPDIIFFWVARMIMSNLKFDGRIPFKDVYFTSTIRDGKGRKLSKSLGNSPDPLNIIAKYGADAVRFTMLYLSPLGQDVKMDVDVKNQDISSMEIGRNFANKIWNAGRFIIIKKDEIENFNPDAQIPQPTISEKWILSRLNNTIKQIEYALDNYKVNEYSKILYDFIWRDFCDWYIEIFKVNFNNAANDEDKSALINLALSVYMDIIKLLHPLMPFITEELYHIITNADENESISLQNTPGYSDELILQDIEDDFAIFQMIVDELRSMKAQLNIPPSKKLPITIVTKDENLFAIFNKLSSVIKNLAKASDININKEFAKPKNSISSVVRNNEIYLLLDESIDLEKEKTRMIDEQKRLEKNIKGIESKLNNEHFVNKAPENVVRLEREKLENMKESLKKILVNIESL